MWELLVLLLPVAAASGFIAGRRSAARAKPETVFKNHPTYFRGLNFLLNEESDKAIETFVELLEVDSETVEIHMALASLFRKNGEADRAIRIHQNLIARPALSRADRTKALMALGKDYMAAGFLDRAEGIFEQLCNEKAVADQALRQLLALYQIEKEWDKAIQAARRLQSRGGPDMRLQIAHFYCEMAEAAMRREDLTEAMSLNRKAMAADSNCARASLLQGEILMRRGRYEPAIRALRQVEAQDVDLLPEVIGPIYQCFAAENRLGHFNRYLQDLMRRFPSVGQRLMCSRLLALDITDTETLRCIIDAVQAHPSLPGLAFWIERERQAGQGLSADALRNLSALANTLASERFAYRCSNCGFKSHHLHWHCPSCQSWSTCKPVA